MSSIRNEVRRGAYLDSVALMRISRELTGLEGVEEAGVMVGTPANRAILREAGVLAVEGEAAGAGDLIIAVRARTEAQATAAIARAGELLDARRQGATAGAAIGSGGTPAWQPRTLRSGLEQLPDANLALISVPGDFAAAEARKALSRGLNVMIFSDNVALADEVALKREARALGLLVMGPDCGTAILSGVPLGFANVVPKGAIGVVGASGTGIQEVSCLIARAWGGQGISHAIGTGGRDLKAEVGGLTTLMAIDLLDADPATQHIVVISKPPAAAVARLVLARVGKSAKPFTICFLGSEPMEMPSNARQVSTLAAAAEAAIDAVPVGGVAGVPSRPVVTTVVMPVVRPISGSDICGLFAGGTLCAEAQVVFRARGLGVRSNAPIAGVPALDPSGLVSGHKLIDLGADEFTRGRPHPMIEPGVRDQPLREAAARASTGVILLDLVLGFGAHPDPAGHLAGVVATLPRKPVIVASVTGTDGDPQGYRAQVAKLTAAGIEVLASNRAAAERAVALIAAARS